MKILSIDPGNIESAYCIIDTETYKPIEFGKIENEKLALGMRFAEYDLLVIEMVASYGMPVGETVFETCVWIGKFIQIAQDRKVKTNKIYRKDEKNEYMSLYESQR